MSKKKNQTWYIIECNEPLEPYQFSKAANAPFHIGINMMDASRLLCLAFSKQIVDC